MKHRIVMGSSLAIVLLVSGAFAADDLKSGPQVGAKARPAPFHPLHASGANAGKKVCLV